MEELPIIQNPYDLIKRYVPISGCVRSFAERSSVPESEHVNASSVPFKSRDLLL